MNLERVRSVLECILFAELLVRELAGLAHRYETGSDGVCDWSRKDIPASLDSNDVLDAATGKSLDEKVDRAAKPLLIFQQRGNVTEKDPGNRKIRDCSN